MDGPARLGYDASIEVTLTTALDALLILIRMTFEKTA